MCTASMPSTPTPRSTSSDLILVGPCSARPFESMTSCNFREAFVADDESSTPATLTHRSGDLAGCRGLEQLQARVSAQLVVTISRAAGFSRAGEGKIFHL